MAREINEIRKALERQGWRIRPGRKHDMAFPPDKTKGPVALPHTPSGARWLPNLLSDLRDRGFEWKGK